MELHKLEGFSTNKSQQTKTCSFAKIAKAPEFLSSYEFLFRFILRKEVDAIPALSSMETSSTPRSRWNLCSLEDGHSCNRSRVATRIWESNMHHFRNKESILKLGWASAKNNGTVAMPYPLTTVTILLTGEAFRGFQPCRECNWHKATYSASMSDQPVFFGCHIFFCSF